MFDRLVLLSDGKVGCCPVSLWAVPFVDGASVVGIIYCVFECVYV